jgi:centrosomal protein CEP104
MGKLIQERSQGQGHPESLKGQEANYTGLDDMLAAFGVYATSSLFSKRYQLREAALGVIMEKGDAILKHVSAADLLDAVVLYLGNRGFGLGDSIASVFYTAADVMEAVLTGRFQGDPDPSLRKHGSACVDRLIDRLGDSNTRIAGATRSLLLLCGKMDAIGKDRVAAAVLARKGKSFRVIVDQVDIIQNLLSDCSVSQIQQHYPALALESIYSKLVVPGISHAHQEARERSLDLLVSLHTKFGAKAVEPLLDRLKPSQRKLADEKLSSGDASASHNEVEEQQSPSSPKEKPRIRRKIEAAQDKDQRLGDEESGTGDGLGQKQSNSNRVVTVKQSTPQASPKRNSVVVEETPPGRTTSGKRMEDTPQSPTPARRKPPAPVPGECQFCKLADDAFFEHEELVQHFMSECPMLCTCPLCKLPVEIREVHWHLTQDCEQKRRLKQCPICLEAVREADYDVHVASRKCLPYQDDVQVCPLCHEKMPAGDAFWEVHILTPPFCPSNPRTATAS